MNQQLDAWRGEFGDAYIARNRLTPEITRKKLAEWARLLASLAGNPPRSILEVGCNVGHNLAALAALTDAELFAVEPNEKARRELLASGLIAPSRLFDASAMDLPFETASKDLVFTAGVLIHIAPDDLPRACDEIYRVSRKYVAAIEYFSDQPEEKPYRGHRGLLYLRDFGSFWLDRHPDLEVVDYGFFWRRLGIDNLTWWILRKPD